MQSYKKPPLLMCLIFSICALTPTQTRALTPTQAGLTATSLFLAVSIYKYLQTLPEDRKNTYDTPEFNEALAALKQGTDITKNLNIISNYSYELWTDGFCGHGSRIGSPRFNEKTKLHEIPVIDSRGILGWISNQVDPIKKTAEAATNSVVTIGSVYMGYVTWKALVLGDAPATKSLANLTAKVWGPLCDKHPILCPDKSVKA